MRGKYNFKRKKHYHFNTRIKYIEVTPEYFKTLVPEILEKQWQDIPCNIIKLKLTNLNFADYDRKLVSFFFEH